MKLPDLDRLIVATLAEAYVIAIIFNVIHCKPANIGEIISSTLLALVLAIPMVPVTWAALLILFFPVYVLMQIRSRRRSKNERHASRKEQSTELDISRPNTSDTVDAEVCPATELPALPKLPKRPQLPAVPESPKPPKSPQLPAISQPPKPPKAPQLPAVPEKSKLPKRVD